MKEKQFTSSSKGRVERCLLLVVVFFIPSCESSIGSDHSFEPKGRVGGDSEAMATLPGGVRDSGEGARNSLEIEALARFAVDEHNKKENALKELSRVVKAEEQVVAGTLHHLTLEVIEDGEKKLYKAKVWIKPWLDFKELQEFEFVGDQPAPVFTAADLGAKRIPEEGWREVPAHDPEVQDAAARAIKMIQDRSNSLLPYELLEIIHSKAEVIDELAKFDMLLKLKRGNNEEKFKVEVHKNLEGNFHLNQMQLEN